MHEYGWEASGGWSAVLSLATFKAALRPRLLAGAGIVCHIIRRMNQPVDTCYYHIHISKFMDIVYSICRHKDIPACLSHERAARAGLCFYLLAFQLDMLQPVSYNHWARSGYPRTGNTKSWPKADAVGEFRGFLARTADTFGHERF